MQSPSEKHLYEYAVIRYVPRVEREEFVNVGLLMMCKRRRWLRVAINVNEPRVTAICPDADMETLRGQLSSFELIAAGTSGPIGDLDPHERFRWLTAVRSASIQTSRPHPGKTADLDQTFDRLLAELVI
ncbi:MAG: DUF3037 domain-containing protein [Pseudoflavonifractor sp.]|nr:DUF3037 domain-containing protein [Pseudoflavonifractor sp.]